MNRLLPIACLALLALAACKRPANEDADIKLFAAEV